MSKRKDAPKSAKKSEPLLKKPRSIPKEESVLKTNPVPEKKANVKRKVETSSSSSSSSSSSNEEEYPYRCTQCERGIADGEVAECSKCEKDFCMLCLDGEVCDKCEKKRAAKENESSLSSSSSSSDKDDEDGEDDKDEDESHSASEIMCSTMLCTNLVTYPCNNCQEYEHCDVCLRNHQYFEPTTSKDSSRPPKRHLCPYCVQRKEDEEEEKEEKEQSDQSCSFCDLTRGRAVGSKLVRCQGCHRRVCFGCMPNMDDVSIFGDGHLCEDCIHAVLNVAIVVAKNTGKSKLVKNKKR
jgi:hypothetical protein